LCSSQQTGGGSNEGKREKFHLHRDVE
jgi:hypothetical protein